MSDDANTNAQVRGAQAEGELRQTEAHFVGLRAAMMEEIIRSAPEHIAKRERLIAGVQVLDGVRNALRKAVADGASAKQFGEYHELLASNTTLLRP